MLCEVLDKCDGHLGVLKQFRIVLSHSHTSICIVHKTHTSRTFRCEDLVLNRKQYHLFTWLISSYSGFGICIFRQVLTMLLLCVIWSAFFGGCVWKILNQIQNDQVDNTPKCYRICRSPTFSINSLIYPHAIDIFVQFSSLI